MVIHPPYDKRLIRNFEHKIKKNSRIRTRKVSEFFEYEEIVGERFANGKVRPPKNSILFGKFMRFGLKYFEFYFQEEYLVRWKGFSSENDSWLTKEQLVHHEPIEKFNKSLIKQELLDHVSFMLLSTLRKEFYIY